MKDKEPPKTAAERQRLWRERKRDQGYRREIVWLDPDVSELIDKALAESPQANIKEIINQAIRSQLKD